MIKTKLIFHHSASQAQSQYDSIREYHERKWPEMKYTSYHVFLEKNGSIIWNPAGLESILYHVGQYNKESIGVCLAGHFGKERPTQEQINALVFVVKAIKKKYKVELFNHKDLRQTSCPVMDLRYLYESQRSPLVIHGEAQIRRLQRGIARSGGRVRNMLERTLERLKKRLSR